MNPVNISAVQRILREWAAQGYVSDENAGIGVIPRLESSGINTRLALAFTRKGRVLTTIYAYATAAARNADTGRDVNVGSIVYGETSGPLAFWSGSAWTVNSFAVSADLLEVLSTMASSLTIPDGVPIPGPPGTTEFSDLDGRPSTLTGYGIEDAVKAPARVGRYADEAQLDVGNMFNVLNRVEVVGANNGVGPQLRAVGFDDDIPLILIAKGLGSLVFGNGAGVIFEAVDAGENQNTYNWPKLFASGSASDPGISSTRGWRQRIAGTNTFQVETDNVSILRVRKASGTNPKALVVEVTDTSVTMKTGDATPLRAVGLVQNGRRTSTGYNAQNPASGATINTASDLTELVIANGGVTLAALTVVLPLDPIDGQEFLLASQANITALTLQASASPAGQTISGTETTMTSRTPLRWRYYGGAFNRWIRI